MAEPRGGIVVFYAPYLYMNEGMPRLLAHFASGAVAGVRTVDVTTATMRDIARAAGEADGIMIDQSVANAAASADVNRHPTYHVLGLRDRAHYDDAFELLLDVPVPRAFFSYTDLHEPADEVLHRRVAGRVQAFLWLFEKEPLTLEQVPPHYREPFMTKHVNSAARWHTVRERFPVRIEAWFPISMDEILPRARTPSWDACVPGVAYATRKIAQRSVAASGLSQAPYRRYSLAIRAAARGLMLLPRRQVRTRLVNGAFHILQQRVIERSRATFVCGSGLGYPSRKYLEVPAGHSALIAYPFRGFEHFGFRDGVNTVVSLPEDTGRAMQRLAATKGQREKLIAASIALLLERHTTERRAEDIAAALRRMVAGTLRGAQFIDGRFEIT